MCQIYRDFHRDFQFNNVSLDAILGFLDSGLGHAGNRQTSGDLLGNGWENDATWGCMALQPTTTHGNQYRADGGTFQE